jgi:hypothetical protein
LALLGWTARKPGSARTNKIPAITLQPSAHQFGRSSNEAEKRNPSQVLKASRANTTSNMTKPFTLKAFFS